MAPSRHRARRLQAGLPTLNGGVQKPEVSIRWREAVTELEGIGGVPSYSSCMGHSKEFGPRIRDGVEKMGHRKSPRLPLENYRHIIVVSNLLKC